MRASAVILRPIPVLGGEGGSPGRPLPIAKPDPETLKEGGVGGGGAGTH